MCVFSTSTLVWVYLRSFQLGRATGEQIVRLDGSDSRGCVHSHQIITIATVIISLVIKHIYGLPWGVRGPNCLVDICRFVCAI